MRRHSVLMIRKWQDELNSSLVPLLLVALMAWCNAAIASVSIEKVSTLFEQHQMLPPFYLERFQVPLDPKVPEGDQVELAYLVRLADEHPEQKPVLWIHYGGPGSSSILLFKKGIVFTRVLFKKI